MTTEQLLVEIQEVCELNRDARRRCNEVLSRVRGHIEHLKKEASGSYQQGIEDMWEILRRIHLYDDDCFSEHELEDLFEEDNDLMSILLNFSAKEVVEKVKEYDEKKKAEEEANAEPVMGDVVEVIDIDGKFPIEKGIYLARYGVSYVVIFDGYEAPQFISIHTKTLRKTGEHKDLRFVTK